MAPETGVRVIRVRANGLRLMLGHSSKNPSSKIKAKTRPPSLLESGPASSFRAALSLLLFNKFNDPSIRAAPFSAENFVVP